MVLIIETIVEVLKACVSPVALFILALMILIVYIFKAGTNDIFFKKTPRMTLIGACRFFGVKRKSYAGTIVERIYDYYCRGANNLHLEYFRYYRAEFPDFESFLEKKYNLFPDEIESKKSFLLCHKSIDFEAGGHVTDLLEDAVIGGTFRKYMGEHTDDN